MKQLAVTELARILKADRNFTGPRRGFVTGVSTDSRVIKPGDCFFAIAGPNFDGHDYIEQAFAAGAACAVVEKNLPDRPTAKPVLKVESTIAALGSLAAEYRRDAGFRVIAITGSVGKTGTRRIIHHVLSSRCRVFEAPKSFNNNIGLPLTLLGAEPTCELVLAEIGANRPGEIAQLSVIARPDIAVVTNVHAAHLQGFGDLQTIAREKLSVVCGLRDDGDLLINADCKLLVETAKQMQLPCLTFGTSGRADIKAEDPWLGPESSRFTIDGAVVQIPLPGRGSLENALAAWAVCSRLGLSAEDFARALGTIPAIPMRAELLQAGALTIINDCYNANPASMRNALEILASLDLAGMTRRRVLICGDMAELGDHSRQLHAELGPDVARAGVGLVLTVGELARVIAASAAQAADHEIQTESFNDAGELCNNLKKFIQDTDIVLVKGSRINRLESVVEKLTELFS